MHCTVLHCIVTSYRDADRPRPAEQRLHSITLQDRTVQHSTAHHSEDAVSRAPLLLLLLLLLFWSAPPHAAIPVHCSTLKTPCRAATRRGCCCCRWFGQLFRTLPLHDSGVPPDEIVWALPGSPKEVARALFRRHMYKPMNILLASGGGGGGSGDAAAAGAGAPPSSTTSPANSRPGSASKK